MCNLGPCARLQRLMQLPSSTGQRHTEAMQLRSAPWRDHFGGTHADTPMQRLSTPLQWPISTVHLLSAPIQLPTGALQLPISSVQLPTGVGTHENIRRKAVWLSGSMALWHGPSNGGSSIRSLASLHPHGRGRPTVRLPGGRCAPHCGACTWQRGGGT